jgi:hypothetical protein
MTDIILHSVKFVNVYLVNRHFGGPEEGGWYYDAGELIESHATTEDDETLVPQLVEQFSNAERPPLHSVMSNGVYRVVVEDKPGEDWPETTPHYE